MTLLADRRCCARRALRAYRRSALPSSCSPTRHRAVRRLAPDACAGRFRRRWQRGRRWHPMTSAPRSRRPTGLMGTPAPGLRSRRHGGLRDRAPCAATRPAAELRNLVLPARRRAGEQFPVQARRRERRQRVVVQSPERCLPARVAARDHREAANCIRMGTDEGSNAQPRGRDRVRRERRARRWTRLDLYQRSQFARASAGGERAGADRAVSVTDSRSRRSRSTERSPPETSPPTLRPMPSSKAWRGRHRAAPIRAGSLRRHRPGRSSASTAAARRAFSRRTAHSKSPRPDSRSSPSSSPIRRWSRGPTSRRSLSSSATTCRCPASSGTGRSGICACRPSRRARARNPDSSFATS